MFWKSDQGNAYNVALMQVSTVQVPQSFLSSSNPRGGAFKNDDAIGATASAQLIPGLDCIDVDSESDAGPGKFVSDGVVRGAVQVDDINGSIDGDQHIAAWTIGDGACGLHSVWGKCHRMGAALYANAAREHLLASVPDNINDFCMIGGGVFRDAFLTLLRTVLQDQVMIAAKATMEHGHVGGCPVWRQQVWAHVPDALKTDCVDFVAVGAQERDHVEQHLMPELQAFARAFFVRSNEAGLVRPLCVMLGYFNVGAEKNLLDASPDDLDQGLEGASGGLELLHPWAVEPKCTKYQALFHQSDAADVIRSSFFLCGSSQKEHVILDMLELLEDLVVQDAEAVALVQRGRKAVAARINAFGNLVYPTSCTLQVAWTALRGAMAQDGYYFSVMELQLLLAACGTLVEAYTFDDSADAEDALVHLVSPAYFHCSGATESIKVVLDPRGDSDGLRGGHFSRLWSVAEWETQPAWRNAGGSNINSSDESDESEKRSGPESMLLDSDENEAESADAAEPAETPAEDKAEGMDDDLDSLSDMTDGSDLFHIDVLPAGARSSGLRSWETYEDRLDGVVCRLARHLRRFPLMPADESDPTGEASYRDMDSCVRLPILHCAFKGCKWRSDVYCANLYHWQLEIEICNHIMEQHKDAMEEVQTWIAERTDEKDDKDELLIMKMAPRWHPKKQKQGLSKII